ncbi:MAG: hypothetical protein JWM83_1360 [Candidatus Angelobacter sp.]|nr:hypothetical protein [Candidatus Angelobacter sp.]
MNGVIFERDNLSADSSAGGYAIAVLYVAQNFLPTLGLALLKIERSKNKEQGKQQEYSQTSACGALKQKHTYCVIHHFEKIAFTAAHTLASRSVRAYTLICDR